MLKAIDDSFPWQVFPLLGKIVCEAEGDSVVQNAGLSKGEGVVQNLSSVNRGNLVVIRLQLCDQKLPVTLVVIDSESNLSALSGLSEIERSCCKVTRA